MIGDSNLDEVHPLYNQRAHLEGEVRRERLRGDGLMALRRNRSRVEIAALKKWFVHTHDPAELERGYNKFQEKLVRALERAEAYERICDLPRF